MPRKFVLLQGKVSRLLQHPRSMIGSLWKLDLHLDPPLLVRIRKVTADLAILEVPVDPHLEVADRVMEAAVDQEETTSSTQEQIQVSEKPHQKAGKATTAEKYNV